MKKLTALMLCVVALLGAMSVPAQSNLGTPVLLISVDFDRWQTDLPQSNAASLMALPEVQTLQTDLINALTAMTGMSADQAGSMMTGQACVAVMLQSDPQMPVPMPVVGIALNQPNAESTLQQAGLPALAVNGDVAVGSTSQPLADALAARYAANGPSGLGLAPNASDFLTMKVNLAALVQAGSSTSQQMAMMNALGLGNLQRMEVHSGFEGTGINTDLTLATNGPRQGLMDLLQSGGDFQTLQMIPQDVMGVQSIRVKSLGSIIDIVNQALMASGDPNLQSQFQGGLMMASMMIGDPQALLNAIGPEITTASRAGGSAVVMDSNNPQLVIQTITNSSQMMGGGMGMGMPGMGMTEQSGPSIGQSSESGVNYSTLDVGMGSVICFGEVQGKLVIATEEGLMRDVIRTANGGTNVLQGGLFDEARSRMSASTASIGVQDDVAMIRESASEAGSIPPIAGLATMMNAMEAAASAAERQGNATTITSLNTAPDSISLSIESGSGLEVVGALAVAHAALAMSGDPMMMMGGSPMMPSEAGMMPTSPAMMPTSPSNPPPSANYTKPQY